MERMIKGGGDRVVDWIWRLCNMAFESGLMLEALEICCDCYKGTVQG